MILGLIIGVIIAGLPTIALGFGAGLLTGWVKWERDR